MRPVLTLVGLPPEGTVGAYSPRVWLPTGRCALVKRESLDREGLDESLSKRHALLFHAGDQDKSLVVLRLSDATIAVRRWAGGATGERTALDPAGATAVVRPGDEIVRWPFRRYFFSSHLVFSTRISPPPDFRRRPRCASTTPHRLRRLADTAPTSPG